MKARKQGDVKEWRPMIRGVGGVRAAEEDREGNGGGVR